MCSPVNSAELEKGGGHWRRINLFGRGLGGWGRRSSITKRLLTDLIELLKTQVLEAGTRMVSWHLRGKGTRP